MIRKKMFVRSEEGNTIAYKISSEMCHVDRVVEQCKEDLGRFNISSNSPELKVILRELLNNAVKHGNHEIIEKTVTCSIAYMGARRFKVTVEDQGKGFHYSNIDMDLPKDTERVSRRGYALIKALSNKIEFNEKGNRISAYIEIHYE